MHFSLSLSLSLSFVVCSFLLCVVAFVANKAIYHCLYSEKETNVPLLSLISIFSTYLLVTDEELVSHTGFRTTVAFSVTIMNTSLCVPKQNRKKLCALKIASCFLVN